VRGVQHGRIRSACRSRASAPRAGGAGNTLVWRTRPAARRWAPSIAALLRRIGALIENKGVARRAGRPACSESRRSSPRFGVTCLLCQKGDWPGAGRAGSRSVVCTPRWVKRASWGARGTRRKAKDLVGVLGVSRGRTAIATDTQLSVFSATCQVPHEYGLVACARVTVRWDRSACRHRGSALRAGGAGSTPIGRTCPAARRARGSRNRGGGGASATDRHGSAGFPQGYGRAIHTRFA